MLIKEWQAKKLYINKAQLEKALGVSLSELPTKLFEYNEPLEDYLLPYSSMPYFDEYDAIALLQGFNPEEYRYMKNKPNFYVIHRALLGSIQQGELGFSTYNDYSNTDPAELKIEHQALEKWAKHHGYKWKLPLYSPLNNNLIATADNSELLQQLTAKDEEIAGLKAENEQLKQRIAELEQENQNLKKTEAVNYDKCSIYGHTSEGIEVIFKMAKKISENCDPDNPHSYPSKEQVINEVKRIYSDSNELATSIYQVITSEKVKRRGRPPKGVDTFQGFI